MRDLQKDLEICQAATPGPWFTYRVTSGKVTVQCPPGWICVMSDKGDMATAKFIAEAREGWSEAIRRAMAAEEQVKKLRIENDKLKSVLFRCRDELEKYGQYADVVFLFESIQEILEGGEQDA